ncbi:hypothetical protein [Aureimonas psammosilenae]|uniref:hypothetical protein n=1 Tax=Aureimonas psammosilenae TaxID=2495496 RepID=UPI00126109AB|nr:hypothetical protein [Aureimonas psammosilenae]
MKRRWKFATGLGLLLLAVLGLVGAPIAIVETACRGESAGEAYQPIITDAAWQRPEARTFLTYPEWHMVYAYEDLAKVLERGDEHDFGYLRAMASFWSSYCALNREADAHGGADGATRQMIYTIGTSFDLELGLKALYENTLGRLATLVRGPEKVPQDQVAAEMARQYGAFLHQTPWYKFPFAEWSDRLWTAPVTGGLRSWERRLALGGEWSAKQFYAGAIESAVAATGQDQLRIRSVVRGLSTDALAAIPGVAVVAESEKGTVIETDRYAAFTAILKTLADAGATVVEIAGNDDIMLSTLQPPSPPPLSDGVRAVYSFDAREGGTRRVLVLLKVAALSDILRAAAGSGVTVEHVFDY